MKLLFETMTLCMKYFCPVITNLNLHTEYLITRSISTRGFNVPVVAVWQKKIDKLLWIHVLHKIKGLFRYEYFFISLFGVKKYDTGIPRYLLPLGGIGLRSLWFIKPFLPLPII